VGRGLAVPLLSLIFTFKQNGKQLAEVGVYVDMCICLFEGWDEEFGRNFEPGTLNLSR
jgi:hypothetical protein